MKKTMMWGAAAALALALQGCAWVKLTPEGEKARVLSAEEVANCTKLGVTTSTLKADVAGFRRNEEKVRKELATLARNAASDLGGDTVVPITEPEGGRQTFDVYRCLNP